VNGLGDVFQCLLAEIFDRKIELPASLGDDRAGHADAAGFGQPFQPRGDVDAIAKQIIAVEDHVAEIDPDPELDAPVGHLGGIALRHRPLHRDGTAHRIDDAAELDQHPIAGGLDDPAVMLGDLRIDELAAQRLEAFERALLILPHQPRIPRHIGGKYRGKTAFDANSPYRLHGASRCRVILYHPVPDAH